MPMAVDIFEWDKIKPQAETIQNLIENKNINVLCVIECISYENISMLIETIKKYTFYYSDDIYIHLLVYRSEKHNAIVNETLLRATESYNLECRVVEDYSTLLSYYLGCDFLLNIVDVTSVNSIQDAEYLQLPIVTLQTNNNEKQRNWTSLSVGCIEEVVAAIHIISADVKKRMWLRKQGIDDLIEKYRVHILN